MPFGSYGSRVIVSASEMDHMKTFGNVVYSPH